jgi:hypothetical protein
MYLFFSHPDKSKSVAEKRFQAQEDRKTLNRDCAWIIGTVLQGSMRFTPLWGSNALNHGCNVTGEQGCSGGK